MPDYLIDRRDVDFVLFEQFPLQNFSRYERYADFDEEDYRAILDTGVKLFKEVLAPSNIPTDREGCHFEGGHVRVPDALRKPWEQYREGGWVGAARPPEVGGMGLPLSLAVVATELAIIANPSFVFFPGLTAAAGHLLEAFAQPEMRDLVVPKLYSGEWTGSMCLTEPQAGSAVGDLTTKAIAVEGSDGEYLIAGSKIFITCGEHDLSENIIHLVLARAPGDPAGTKGISLFAVPKFRFDENGNIGQTNDVVCTGIEEKMGIHGSPTCALTFGEKGDCRGYLIGKRSEGIIYMFQMMNEARIVCGIQGVAAANCGYQLALAYAKERVQGSKIGDRSGKSVPIIEHPDVRRNLMLSKSWSEGLRALLVQAAVYATHAECAEDETERALNQDLLDLMTPICKAYATDFGFKVTELAIQIHGGYGYIKEYGVEQLMRDVKIASLYEGTNGIQALDLLGRKMRQKNGVAFMSWLGKMTEFISKHKEHPRIADIVTALERGKNSLADAAMSLGGQAGSDLEGALQSATPFLELFGHVEVARLLTEQAVLADEKRAHLTTEHPDFRFYEGKVKTARFFANTVLPHATAIAKSIKAADRSALEMEF